MDFSYKKQFEYVSVGFKTEHNLSQQAIHFHIKVVPIIKTFFNTDKNNL